MLIIECPNLSPMVKPSAYVLGLFDTGLGVVRSLARKGVRVLGFDSDVANCGFHSRHAQSQVCPDPTHEPDRLIEFLSRAAAREPVPPILFPTSDAFVLFLSRRRDELGRWSRFVLPERDVVEDVVDKRRQYARAAGIGIPLPRTHSIRGLDELAGIADELDYPVIVKPVLGHVWREQYRDVKCVQVESRNDLTALYREIVQAGQEVLIQSIILGPNSNLAMVCAYMGEDNEPVAVICMRKIRQYPMDIGVGTLVESVRDPKLEELGLRFFQELGWRGPGEVEFKKDARDGCWKLIELNPRLWQQSGLADACGLNFPWIQYELHCGRRPELKPYREGVRWVNEFYDPRSAWSHHRQGRLSLGAYVQSLRKIEDRALFAFDDPGPFIYSLWRQAAALWRKLFRSLLRPSR
jgi:predicted ATP-grasp superfamily ATP-dependent carboligase